jgi:small subunit ribosomal protein S2
MKALLESGVHFGHRTNKWNPKMRSYIFTERNGIHIIDLQQTVDLLDEAYDFIRDKVANGGTVLFVGTKRQAQDTIREQAERCGMPYVNERWLGGTITNWFTIQKRIFELERLERMRDSGEIDLLTKKEGLMIEREIERLEKRLSGIRIMKRLPDVLFVVDVSREDTAVHEANLKEIPVVAMVDTNCDPDNIDYIIPSNDDAIRAIKLLVGKLADAVMEGRAIRGKEAEEEEMMAEPMPAEVSRFIDDEDELEDEELLGESTLKHLGTPKKSKRRAPDLDEEDEEEEIIDEALEEVIEEKEPEELEEESDEELEKSEEELEEESEEEPEESEEEPEVDEDEPSEDSEEEPEEDVEEESDDEEED